MPNTTLHILNKSGAFSSLNTKLSETISKGDEVVLIADGTYQTLDNLSGTESTTWAITANKVYALKDDLLTRGIPLRNDLITYISYEEFVQLSLTHHKTISWH